MLRTARRFQRPPTGWVLGRRDGAWTDLDYTLTLTLEKYEAGLCSCGNPTIIAHHPDNDGWYDVTARQCHACAEIERASDAKKKPEPGTKVTATYSRTKPLGPWPNP